MNRTSWLDVLKRRWATAAGRRGKSGRRGSRRRARSIVPQLERLEDRTLLSVSTPVLGASNDVVFNGDGDVDTVFLSVTSTGLVQHNLGGVGGFHSNIDLDSVTAGDQTRAVADLTSLTDADAGDNDAVTFHGRDWNFNNAAFTTIKVTAGTIRLQTDIETTGTGAVTPLPVRMSPAMELIFALPRKKSVGSQARPVRGIELNDSLLTAPSYHDVSIDRSYLGPSIQRHTGDRRDTGSLQVDPGGIGTDTQ